MGALGRVALVAGLLVGLAAGSGAGERRALLVGINDYTYGGDQWDLRGCVNDVEMVRDALVQEFGFPPDNVHVLLDGQASAAGIRREFEDWLIARSGPDDVAYFHYSGHGSRINDTNGDEADGWDEMLCPADIKSGDRRSMIVDDELSDLLDRIRARQVVVVLDACHSGTGTRDLSLCRPRFIDLGAGASGSRAIGVAAPQGAEAASSGADWSEVQSSARVTLSGCRADQTSADAWIEEGFYAGAFTYNLVRALRSLPPGARYSEVLERVSRDMAGNYYQVPQLDGDGSAAFLGLGFAAMAGGGAASGSGAAGSAATGLPAGAVPVNGADAGPPSVEVKGVSGPDVTLGGGLAAGMTQGSLFRVYPAVDASMTGEGLGLVQVEEVNATEARALVLVDEGIIAGARAREVAHQAGAASLAVRLDGEDARLSRALAAELEALGFVTVVPGAAHFDVRVTAGREARVVRLALLADGQVRAEVREAAVGAAVQALRPHLANAFLVKQLGELDNPAPEFGVRVWANRASANGGDVAAALDQAPDQRLMRARVGDVVRFCFEADRDCYLTMVNVGTSGKVTVLFPNQYRPDGFVRGGVVYQTETPGEMPFKIRATGPAGRELVKVIATAQPLDLSSLRMGEAAGAGTRSIGDGVGFTAQLQRDMAAVPAADPGVAQVAAPGLIPTAGWATDYLILDTYE